MTDWEPAASDPGIRAGLATFIALAALGGAVIGGTRGHRDTRRSQAILFLIAFALRFAASVAIYAGGLVSVVGDEDGEGWRVGARLHREWVARGAGWLDLPACFAEAYQSHHRGYAYLLGVFFHVSPPVRLSAAALNGCLGALTAVLVFRIACDLSGRNAARFAGWWVCAMPSLIAWSAMTIKEPVVLFLSSVALYGCLQVRSRGVAWRHVAAMLAAITLLVPFRFYAAYATTAAVFAGLVVPRLEGGRIARGRVGAAVVIAAWLLLSGVLARHGPGPDAKFESLSIRVVERARISNGHGGSAALAAHNLRSPRGFGLAVAEGAVHLLLAPFPWQIVRGSLRERLVLPEMLVWWWLLGARVIPGTRTLARARLGDIVPILVLVGGLGLLYSLTFSNVGLVFRQRSQLLPWMFILASAAGYGPPRLWKGPRPVG